MHLCLPWVFATVTTLVISADGFPSFPYKSHSIRTSDASRAAHQSSGSALVSTRAGTSSSREGAEESPYFDDEDNPKAELSDARRDLFDLLRLKYSKTSKRSSSLHNRKVYTEDKENQDGERNTEEERRSLMVPDSLIDNSFESALRKRDKVFRGLSMEVPDSYSLQERNRPNWLVFKKNDAGPSLSIYSPLEVLRQRVLLEMARRRKEEARHQIQANHEILKDKGKRSASYWQSAWSSTDNEKEPFRQRNSRGTISTDNEGYV